MQNAGAFLPHAVADVLKGTLGVFANRMSKLLFNLTVEHNITNHLLAADVDMTREEYNKLRGARSPAHGYDLAERCDSGGLL